MRHGPTRSLDRPQGTDDAKMSLEPSAAQRVATGGRRIEGAQGSPRTRAVRRGLRDAAVVLAFVGGYVLLDGASYLHPVAPYAITPWSPAVGLVLVGLLRYGAAGLPFAIAAPVLADVILRGAPGTFAPLLLGSTVAALAYFVTTLVMRLVQLDPRLPTARDVAWLVGLLAPASLLVALGYVSLVFELGRLDAAEWWPAVLRYWVGDLNGLLVVAPILLLWDRDLVAGLRRRWHAARIVEVGLQAGAIALVLWLVLAWAGRGEFRFFYLMFLPLIWVALRFGVPGAAIALAFVQVGLTLADVGRGFETTTFVELQIRMAALSVTALMLGAVVSERERTRDELLQQQPALDRAQQFAVAGEMSAALAHEVNNPIGALTTYLQAASRMLDRLPGADPRLAETLAKALAESRRASDVIKTLRNVYGADRLVPATVDVARLCRKVVEQFRGEAERRRVELALALADRSLAVRGEEFQLQIVLRNLVENAIHAADSGPGPERRVTVGAGLASGRVQVTVDDSGTGFSFDGSPPAFPPVPSTKPGGMGLGLAIARRIVDAHGARMRAAPRPSGGTRFEVEFPPQGPVESGGAQ